MCWMAGNIMGLPVLTTTTGEARQMNKKYNPAIVATAIRARPSLAVALPANR
jgi:hypothetical protein